MWPWTNPAFFLVLGDVLASVRALDGAVSRHHAGDLFSQCGGCGEEAAPARGSPCRCQCAPSHHTYREDIGRCVKDLGECRLAAFVRPRSVMEQIPLVFLPLTGQLVHPGAHLSLSGVASVEPLWCRVNRTQYLSPGGWRDAAGRLFSLYQDGNRTFVQWLGDERARWNLQHKLLLVRVLCTDEQGALFEPCIAFRAAWAPGVTGTVGRATDYTVVGLCLGVLGLVYVVGILVFLRVRRNRSKSGDGQLPGTEHPPALTERPVSRQSQLVAASTGAGTDGITADRRDFLVIDPQLLEPEMLASPPPPAQEFLAKIREMISVARARMRNFRFRPTLVDIPEDDYYYYKEFGDGGRVHHNPIFPSNDGSRRTFVVAECYQVTAVDSCPVKFPPRPPRRRKRKSSPEEQDRFEGFRHDLYEKLQRIRELNSADSGDGCPYENVVPPPPRPICSPVSERDTVEEDSLCSPTDSLNSRGGHPFPSGVLRDVGRTLVLSEHLERGVTHFLPSRCMDVYPRSSLRGFDATEALRSEFLHVCQREVRDSLGESSYESDSLVSGASLSSVSDTDYDPDYSDPAAEPNAPRLKRRLRSRAERSGKQNPDVTIIEVGNAALGERVLNGKGNFVTLIELETSDAST